MNTDQVGINSLSTIRLVVAAPDFQAGLSFFTDELGFAVAMIAPAEDPNVAVLTLEGLTVSLDKHSESAPVTLEIPTDESELLGTSKEGPNGTKVSYVTFARESDKMTKPSPTLAIAEQSDAHWVTGRAGMAYRSLIDHPNSGFTASHIRIEGSGEVPDWVHFHDVGFQIIYCFRGSAKLVYEGQGEPFIFNEGDCVLQPPHIRHRVLESFNDLEVIEFSSPSNHATYADPVMDLPNELLTPDRDFSGQRFTLSRQAESHWNNHKDSNSFITRRTSISESSGNVGWVNIIEATGTHQNGVDVSPLNSEATPDFLLWFILEGSGVITHRDKTINLGPTDAVVCPYGYNNETEFSLSECQIGFRVLEIGLNSG
ncbi:MAG: AraC family ligand binding domain-containing protein [Acidimicrobiales bacterium]|jgi:quercetin dioxygenase-like cupin family protein|nr:AraC family ligand binding domain-containing protein [Acidimicrobiales bacterium]HJM27739.1 AraC family ligand binding domain-containing protein [Acidimicrobiales bacterium]